MRKTAFIEMVIFLMILLLTPILIYSQEKIRIGTFDSRCVAIAYGRTDFFKYINELKAEHEKAKAEGNEERVKELDKLGPNLQFIMHQQGFSTGSVMNIMQRIKDKIPAIAEQNNVKFILSKWEVVYQDKSIEIVDVTNQIVSLFNPDAQTLNIVEEIKGMDPVPIEQITNDPNE